MADELIEELTEEPRRRYGESRVALKMNFGCTGIPCSRQPEDGHPYVRLKDLPEKIDVLPELKGRPALREAIVALNSQSSVLETVGCDAGSCEWTQADGTPIASMGSYYSVIFTDERIDNATDWFPVYFRFAKELKEDKILEGALIVKCTLKQFAMYDLNRGGLANGARH